MSKRQLEDRPQLEVADYSLHLRYAEMALRDGYNHAAVRNFHAAIAEVDMAIMELVLAKVSLLQLDDGKG